MKNVFLLVLVSISLSIYASSGSFRSSDLRGGRTPRKKHNPKFSPIKGAFGFFLGNVVKIKGKYKKNIDSYGAYIIKVKPKVTYRSFKDYGITITPISRKVSTITAIYTGSNHKAALNEYLLLIRTIKQKYPKGYEMLVKQPRSTKEHLTLFYALGRHVRILCSYNQVKVKYFDTTLCDLAEKESKRQSKSQSSAL